jgi:hypothetical protein
VEIRLSATALFHSRDTSKQQYGAVSVAYYWLLSSFETDCAHEFFRRDEKVIATARDIQSITELCCGGPGFRRKSESFAAAFAASGLVIVVGYSDTALILPFLGIS